MKLTCLGEQGNESSLESVLLLRELREGESAMSVKIESVSLKVLASELSEENICRKSIIIIPTDYSITCQTKTANWVCIDSINLCIANTCT